MFSILRQFDAKTLATEVPAMGFAILISEFFFKFHSFTLEFLACLAVWGLASALIGKLNP